MDGYVYHGSYWDKNQEIGQMCALMFLFYASDTEITSMGTVKACKMSQRTAHRLSSLMHGTGAIFKFLSLCLLVKPFTPCYLESCAIFENIASHFSKAAQHNMAHYYSVATSQPKTKPSSDQVSPKPRTKKGIGGWQLVWGGLVEISLWREIKGESKVLDALWVNCIWHPSLRCVLLLWEWAL